MIALIPYGIILLFTLIIYWLGEKRGFDKAAKKQALDTLSIVLKNEDNADTRMTRFEERQDAFEKHVGGIDYGKLNDAELERLHKGETLTDFTDGADEITVAHKKPTD